LGKAKGLVFGKPAAATDQNAFAVTTAFAQKNGVKTLSEFAAKCSGQATILGGPPECKERPFCAPGLQKTYALSYGSFTTLDSAGPLSKQALKAGKVSIALVLSSDGSLTASS
jgi:osmoprotectant transport system substrate-binding protein